MDYLGSAGSASTASADSGSAASAATCATVSASASAAGGMAVGTDNQGHIGGETDGVWAKDDPALRVSFGYASEHAMAQAAKAIIAAYYGKPPAYSYYDGCSDGGHEALVEAQRYPRDFNGILAGAPGNIEAQLLGVVPAWLVAVNTGTDGREILTSEKLPALHAAVIKACGNAQGLIEDPRSCDFDPADFRFTVADYDKLLPLAGIYDATDPDLSAFQQAGGKLILYQGWADEKISPFGTVDYYNAVAQQAGGFAASQDFSRLYMIPGQDHCLSNGSPQVNPAAAKSMLLDSLQKWVEQGTAPGSFSFPLLHPAATLSAISVQPLNPVSPPPGGARGLNTQYHWVGEFRPGDELWCGTRGMDLVCGHQPPPVSYTAGTASKADVVASSQ